MKLIICQYKSCSRKGPRDTLQSAVILSSQVKGCGLESQEDPQEAELMILGRVREASLEQEVRYDNGFLCFCRSIQCFNGKDWSGFGMYGPEASQEVFHSLKSLSSRSPSDGCCLVGAQVNSLPGWGGCMTPGRTFPLGIDAPYRQNQALMNSTIQGFVDFVSAPLFLSN